MKKRRSFSLNDNERSILEFIWRVKVVSTSAIFLRYEAEFQWHEYTAYKRLLALKSKGCLTTRHDEAGRFQAWMLTMKGFRAIQQNLLALKEQGFASESVSHDLHAMAAHYGEWIQKGSASDVRFVTEQELRRIDGDDLPKWARPLQIHKPDGVWYFPETIEKSLVALEVELSRKRISDYKELGAFYSEQASIGSVLWIVLSKGHAASIMTALHSAPSSSREIHNFVLLDNFKATGWASVIFRGPNSGMSIHDFLEQTRRNHPGTAQAPPRNRGSVQKILDCRIRRFFSTTCNSAQNSKFRA